MMQSHTLEYSLVQAAQNAPIRGFVYSTQQPIKMIKETYGVDDKRVCAALQKLNEDGYIKEFHIKYSEINPQLIYMYWFK